MAITEGTSAGTGGVTLTEAANVLGISRDALKKRVQRGAIPAYKDEIGAWRVVIPEGDNAGDMSRDMGGGHEPGHLPPTVPPQLTAVMDAWLTPLTDRIAEQAEMIGRLKLENEQLRIALEAAERPADDASPVPPPPVAPGGAERGMQPSWWRRLFGLE